MDRRPVLVVWHDAHAGTDTWIDLNTSTDTGPYVVRSVGWLMREDCGGKPGHISLAQSWSDEDAIDSVLHIPVAMVQQIIHMKGKRRAEQGHNGKNRSLSEPSSSERL